MTVQPKIHVQSLRLSISGAMSYQLQIDLLAWGGL